MNERQWEFYRLSVVEMWPESPLKNALLCAIRHKLRVLECFESTRSSEDFGRNEVGGA
jgi:hypothetical protein